MNIFSKIILMQIVSIAWKKLFFIYIQQKIHPVLSVAMSTISEKLHNLWKSSHSIGADSVQMEDEDNKPVLSPETQNRLRLR